MVRSGSVLVVAIAAALLLPVAAHAADTGGACPAGTMLVEGVCEPETPMNHPTSPVPQDDAPGTDQVSVVTIAPPQAVAGVSEAPTDAVSSGVGSPSGQLPFTGLSVAALAFVGALFVLVGAGVHAASRRARRVAIRP